MKVRPRRRRAARRLNGADYVAVVRLSNLANDTLADVGQTCENVPAASLGWLKEQGHIRKREPNSAAPAPVAEAEPVAPPIEEEGL
jgi:hypothetical protein